MLRNCLVLTFCVTAAFLIAEVQSEKCWKIRPETYLMIDKLSYSYVTYDPFTKIMRSQLRTKTITKIGQRTRRILVPCNGTQQPDESLLESKRRHQRFRCRPKCINGDCDVDGNCLCYNGYAEQNGTCVPVCDHCSNITCSTPNNCQCALGYKMVNGSCIPESNATGCSNGYIVVNNNCEPICSSGCPNGYCVGPERCFCLDGFRDAKDENGTDICTPICQRPCDGYCISPDTCLNDCPEGYKADYSDVNNKKCLPVSEDWKGTCPNKCKVEEPHDVSETSTESTTGPYSTASELPILERNNTVEPFVDNYNKSETIHEEILRKSKNQQDGVSILISIIIGRNNCGKYNISVSDGQDEN
ncbi:extracellular matrix organizing protein FRAS1-like isoform X2 [Spodoptera frugiperda]|uniref:Extracellular matrix organizing protein FRAS1-like isoform X2 n=1 Tax=Spodoptera frugiperda TaxID=7108 RepID=A0A9R0F4N2_SPOFR|nr:extracellular matrix organizing protein FRAS1-like isoform X2 [Spodoptera frugiperda]